MLKNDVWIKTQISQGMIDGAAQDLVTRGVLSYGVSSFGYDITLGGELKAIKWGGLGVVDPKRPRGDQWDTIKPDSNNVFLIPPRSFILGHSREYFKLPRDVTGLVFPKSTYARCGLICYQTVLEAGWEGQITLEFANDTPATVALYGNEGCAQVLFFEGEPPQVSYADRHGKYQGQMGVTLARVY